MTELPEAPASVTYSVTSKNGFNALVTYRATSFEELLTNMAKIETLFDKKEYKPQIKQPYGQKKEVKYVEGETCPKDGGRLVEKLTKTGKKCWECENRKYDFTTKQTTGCTYIKWL